MRGKKGTPRASGPHPPQPPLLPSPHGPGPRILLTGPSVIMGNNPGSVWFSPDPFCHFLFEGRARLAALGQSLPPCCSENPEPVRRVWPKLCLVARASSHTAHFCLPQVGSAGARPEVAGGRCSEGPCEYLGTPGFAAPTTGEGKEGAGVPGVPSPCSLSRSGGVCRTGIRGTATCPGAPGRGGRGRRPSGLPGQRDGVQRTLGSRRLVGIQGHQEWAAGRHPILDLPHRLDPHRAEGRSHGGGGRTQRHLPPPPPGGAGPPGPGRGARKAAKKGEARPAQSTLTRPRGGSPGRRSHRGPAHPPGVRLQGPLLPEPQSKTSARQASTHLPCSPERACVRVCTRGVRGYTDLCACVGACGSPRACAGPRVRPGG